MGTDGPVARRTIDADAVQRLLAIFLDGRRTYWARTTAVPQVLQKYAGTPAALDADYQARPALMHDEAEISACVCGRWKRWSSSAIFPRRAYRADDDCCRGVFRSALRGSGNALETRSVTVYGSARCGLRYTMADCKVRLSWLLAARCVRLTKQDVARMQEYLRENDFSGDATVWVSM